jgi:AbrB family looped-hinge helix DNA binding protein
MKAENTTRRLDNLGRITIPKALRSRLGIAEGAELEFFTHKNNGITYICLADVDAKKKSDASAALEVLKEKYTYEEILDLLKG